MFWIIADCFGSFLIIFFCLRSFWVVLDFLWIVVGFCKNFPTFVGLCEFYLGGGGSLWIAVNFLICV